MLKAALYDIWWTNGWFRTNGFSWQEFLQTFVLCKNMKCECIENNCETWIYIGNKSAFLLWKTNEMENFLYKTRIKGLPVVC